MVIGAALERRARLHLDVGPGHLADERAHRPRLLRRDPGGDRRRAARRARRPACRRARSRATSCSCAYASHGDTKHILLFPANPAECFHFAVKAFDLAERFQTPVFMLSDLDIGMNDWVVPAPRVGRRVPPGPRARAHAPPSSRRCRSSSATRPRTSSASRRARCPACTRRARSSRAARATTSSAATPRSPTSTRRSWTASRASTRAARARTCRRRSSRRAPGATFGVVTVGGCDLAVREALDDARRRAASRPTTCASAASRSATRSRRSSHAHEHIFVVEQNRDAQLRTLLTLETGVAEGEAALGARLRRLPAAGRARSSTASSQPQLRAATAAEAAMSYIKKPVARHPSLAAEQARPHRARLRGRDVDAVRRLRPRLGHRRDRARLLRARHAAAHGRQAVGHRLLVEDADVLRLRRARLQLGARPHAGHRDRRQRRQPRPHLHRHLRRRRLALDRPRPAVPRHPPQREHALRHREQRRLRPHQGPVLRVGRHRLEVASSGEANTQQRRSIR